MVCITIMNTPPPLSFIIFLIFLCNILLLMIFRIQIKFMMMMITTIMMMMLIMK
jgi:hypothetical protein